MGLEREVVRAMRGEELLLLRVFGGDRLRTHIDHELDRRSLRVAWSEHRKQPGRRRQGRGR